MCSKELGRLGRQIERKSRIKKRERAEREGPQRWVETPPWVTWGRVTRPPAPENLSFRLTSLILCGTIVGQTPRKPTKGPEMSEKVSCSKCGGERDGAHSYCPDCRKTYAREWRERKKKERAAQAKHDALAEVDCSGTSLIHVICPCCQRRLRVKVR